MKFNWANVDYKKVGLAVAGLVLTILSSAVESERTTEVTREIVRKEIEALKKGEKDD